jgi:RNA polymerase sporulation-specific sigma factor
VLYLLTAAQNDRVTNNIRLVHYLVNKLGIHDGTRDYDDCISLGNYGLLKAAISFDETKGIKFATFAARCIHNEIFMDWRKKRFAEPLFFDDPLNTDVDGNTLLLSDIIADIKESNIEEQTETSDFLADVLNYVLNHLSIRDRLVFLFSIAGLLQTEISEKIGISQSYISRLEKKISDKISRISIDADNLNFSHDKGKDFTVCANGTGFTVSFCTNGFGDFGRIFSKVLLKLSKIDTLQAFNLLSTQNCLTLSLPIDNDSFIILAEILLEFYRISGDENFNSENEDTILSDTS